MVCDIETILTLFELYVIISKRATNPVTSRVYSSSRLEVTPGFEPGNNGFADPVAKVP